MKRILALIIVVFLPLTAYAGDSAKGENSATTHTETGRTAATMVENVDGDLKANEYEVIDPDGAITRAFCPYTCAMRGIEAKYCKAWRSLNDPNLCYVQDTRIQSDAIKWGNGAKGK